MWVPGTLATFQNFGLLILISASACVLLASVVLYFVFSEELGSFYAFGLTLSSNAS